MVTEVLALLVQATVFKIAGSHGNHVIGGFDSHALPPSSSPGRTVQRDQEMHTLVSIQTGKPQALSAEPSHPLSSKPWRTAIFKTPVTGEVAVNAEGLQGDGQADRKNHGGVDKAICVYPVEHLCYWENQLDRTDFGAGAFGENFSVAGLNEKSVAIGDRWQIGTAVFEVSQPRQPCWKLARRWQAQKLAAQAIETGKTGWYLRVIQTGAVSPNAPIEIAPISDTTQPRFSIEQANRLFYDELSGRAEIERLLKVPQLSEAWKSEFRSRLNEA